MRNRIAAAAVAAALAAGCNEDKCPTEPPKLSQVADCTARPGGPVTYPIQLCPTCNQTGATCDVDMSAAATGDIFLDPTVEACSKSSDCPTATCEIAPFACTFTAPTVERDYIVTIFDPERGPITRTLTVSSTLPVSCSLRPL